MSSPTYIGRMSPGDRPLVWLHGQVTTPPLSPDARVEAGFLLRRLQRGDRLAMPDSRPLPSVGRRCHELRIPDEDQTWRIVYRVDPDAVIVLDVFSKKTPQTPGRVVEACRRRLAAYDAI